MPDETLFWDNLADRYAQKPIKDIATYNHTMDRTRTYLSKRDRVLEIGCGSGSTALLLSDDVNHITATDLSSRMIAIGKNKAGEQNNQNVGFMQATVYDDRLKPGSYDVILAFNILHLLEDVPAAIRRINGLVKPGGLFISKTPCLKQMGILPHLLIPALRLFGRAPFVQYLHGDTLEEMVGAEGFEIVEAADHPPARPNRFIVARKK
ncbi:class I SAM-dependent methyltransferase [Nitratireductor sp. XY-223]|uniref:class I SAM-dependent methyltransferase n=1 Tax=Nitratireductor sp. XY-223 TaxID=2561926 RepID=UPI0010AAB06E|nr:class I SAM-dependent methyltransferase [Nitratireductor sp. XY-223]